MNKTIRIYGYEDRIREAIFQSGMNITEVSRQMGIKRQNFYYGHQMNIGNLAKFCAITGVSADYILGLSREVKRK